MTDAKKKKLKIDKEYKTWAEWDADLGNPEIYPPDSEALVDETGCYAVLADKKGE